MSEPRRRARMISTGLAVAAVVLAALVADPSLSEPATPPLAWPRMPRMREMGRPLEAWPGYST